MNEPISGTPVTLTECLGKFSRDVRGAHHCSSPAFFPSRTYFEVSLLPHTPLSLSLSSVTYFFLKTLLYSMFSITYAWETKTGAHPLIRYLHTQCRWREVRQGSPTRLTLGQTRKAELPCAGHMVILHPLSLVPLVFGEAWREDHWTQGSEAWSAVPACLTHCV